jgi:hypothetical protein
MGIDARRGCNRAARLLTAAILAVACAACADGDDGLGPAAGLDHAGLDPDVPPVTAGAWYRPAADVTWQWQIDGTVNTSYDVDLYDVDLFDAPDAALAALRGRGVRVLCYFSAGTYEPGRADAGDIPASARGAQLEDWPSERWLDVRDARVFEVMRSRLARAASRGCDGVEPDNVDGFTNDTGFPLTAADQLAFNRHLANEAHRLGLAIALKNDGDQAAQLVDYFDLELNEECHLYEECAQLEPFHARGKPVLNVEYAADLAAALRARTAVCPAANDAGLRTLILPWDLDDGFRVPCF